MIAEKPTKQQKEREATSLADRQASIKTQLKNNVYRTLLSLMSAMAKYMTPREALEVLKAEMALIEKDLDKSEKRRTNKAAKGKA